MDRKKKIETITEDAVMKAMDIIEDGAGDIVHRGDDPAGDELAYTLHKTIRAALHAHYEFLERTKVKNNPPTLSRLERGLRQAKIAGDQKAVAALSAEIKRLRGR